MGHIPLIEVTRGNITESVHYGSIAIVYGNSTHGFVIGEASRPFFLRSSAKPLQALAFLQKAIAGEMNFSPAEIAIMCASHSGTHQHCEVLINLHEKLGLEEQMLQCGSHMPFDKNTAKEMIISSQQPRPYHNNCSGKHTAMLAFSRLLSVPTENYLDLNHPVQQEIIQTFSEMCQFPADRIVLGVDGCSAPVFAVPLANAARGFANLCQPDQFSASRKKACRAITTSMVTQPEMVAGPDRFDTEFMRVADGKAISKIGAEGFQVIGVFPHANAGHNTSIGIAIKIADGDKSRRASSVATLTILKHLGVLNQQDLADLNAFNNHAILNWKKKEVGEIRPAREFIKQIDDILP